MAQLDLHVGKGKPQPRHYVFLDIDGVLSTHGQWQAANVEVAPCILLRKLIQSTGAALVLNSKWGEHRQYVETVLRNFGVLPGDADATGLGVLKLPSDGGDGADAPHRRERALAAWAASSAAQTCAGWVAFDSAMLGTTTNHSVKLGYKDALAKNVVQTHPEMGLSENNIAEAMKILGFERPGRLLRMSVLERSEEQALHAESRPEVVPEVVQEANLEATPEAPPARPEALQEELPEALPEEPPHTGPKPGHFKLIAEIVGEVTMQDHLLTVAIPLDYEIPIALIMPLMAWFVESAEEQERAANTTGRKSGASEHHYVGHADHHHRKLSSNHWQMLKAMFALEEEDNDIEDAAVDLAAKRIPASKVVLFNHRLRELDAKNNDHGLVGAHDLCEALFVCGVPMLEIMHLARDYTSHDCAVDYSHFVQRVRQHQNHTGIFEPEPAKPVTLVSKKLEAIKVDYQARGSALRHLSKKYKKVKDERDTLKAKIEHSFFNELYGMVNHSRRDEIFRASDSDDDDDDDDDGATADPASPKGAVDVKGGSAPRAPAPGMVMFDGSLSGRLVTAAHEMELMMPMDGQVPVRLAIELFEQLAASAEDFRGAYRAKGASASRMRETWRGIARRLESLPPPVAHAPEADGAARGALEDEDGFAAGGAGEEGTDDGERWEGPSTTTTASSFAALAACAVVIL